MNKRAREEASSEPSTGDEQAAEPDTFWIVGIGASAGGLAAITELLRPLPSDLDMAFVVVMHLDPNHASSLAELLGRAVKMPVVQASDALELEAGHVYVIPPNTSLSVQSARLHLTPREQAPQPLHPIDLLLHSLAEDHGGRSVGIILSGTGSDGTSGLTALKAAGGITFAQDATAAHGEMPRSAIAAGCVDKVLSTETIARELVRISQQPSQWLERRSFEEIAGDDKGATGVLLDNLVRRLSRSTGIDFQNYKQATIRRRIQRRIMLLQLDNLDDYVAFLDEKPEELEVLGQELLIHVTSFFRDPEIFESLERMILPALLKRRSPDEELRLWVPGCATGEEVYSLAILLLEFLGQHSSPPTIKLFGTDVSETAVARARAGRYPEGICSQVSEARLRRFFVKEADGYVITKAVRDLCVFARQDATRDPPFSRLDLISCRNLLIYLGPALQRHVLPMFHYALREGGYLLLGTAETVGVMEDRFTPVEGVRSIYQRKPVPIRLPLELGGTEHPVHRSGSAPAPPARHSPSTLDVQREADRIVLAKFAPPGVVVDESLEILQFRGDTGAFLVPAPGAPSNNLLRMAREGLLFDLRAILEEGKASNGSVRRTGLRIKADGRDVHADIELIPLRISETAGRCFVILFTEHTAETSARRPAEPAPAPRASEASRIAELERELHTTRDYLRANVENLEASNEELRSSNEEVLSSNEELLSTNEELQTAKEELQATNEELLTVNEELQHRNREVTLLGDDLTNLLNSVQIPMVMVGRDLRIRKLTPSASKTFGLLPGDVNGSILETSLERAVDDLEGMLVSVLETLAASEREVQDQDGRWNVLTVRPYRTQDNKVDGAVVTVVDIDARKRLAESFVRARDYAQAIVMAMREPLLVLGADLTIQQGNRAFFEAFRSTPEESEGRRLGQAGTEHWATREVLDAIGAVRDGGPPFADLAVECEVPGRGTRALRLNARAVPGDGEREPLVLLVIEDVTERERERVEREQFAHQLQETQRLESLGILAGGVAHDFNNILTAILGFADLLSSEKSHTAPVAEYVGEIKAGARRAAELCSQMLAYSGRGRFVIEPSNLSELVRQSAPLFEAMVGKQARLLYELSTELPAVDVDIVQIGQVIANLVINASEALGKEGGDIVVKTGVIEADAAYLERAELPGTPAGRYVFLEVSDAGEGMSAETRAHIFDPFFTTKFAGRGLGLAVVLGIARGHAGTLLVESEVGKGSTFRLLLPPGGAHTPEAKPVVPEQAATWTGSGTVLIVDDESSVRSILSKLLKRMGFVVLEATGCKQGLEQVRSHGEEIVVVFLDLTMPGRSGRETFVEMRKLRPELRVILMSGYEEQESMGGFPSASLSGFLRKPFALDALSHQLRQALSDGEESAAPERGAE